MNSKHETGVKRSYGERKGAKNHTNGAKIHPLFDNMVHRRKFP
jgi:hypothetical protein